MAGPARIQRMSFFYAIGNTPAVCLTQSLPPDQDAALLLLGCGDVRNVLFTAYAGPGFDGRKLDITCCDIEAEIIARNITLYTLLIDDEKGENTNLIWCIYYNIMLDDDSLKLLRKQAKKLKDTASTLSEWHNGKYGRQLRFCDTTTFTKVTRLWEFYSIDPSQGRAFSEQQQKLRHGIQEARKTKDHYVGQKENLNGIRSAAPYSLSALEDMPQLYEFYWKEGITALDDSQARHMNPMFGSLRDNLILHYGADTLHAFHFATVYAPISDHSPLKPEGTKGLNKFFEAVLD
ncbi:hypothetical protein VTN96DRAFT_2618 [Rasamsonia emersonii]